MQLHLLFYIHLRVIHKIVFFFNRCWPHRWSLEYCAKTLKAYHTHQIKLGLAKQRRIHLRQIFKGVLDEYSLALNRYNLGEIITSKLHFKSSLNSTGLKFLADWVERNAKLLKVVGAAKSNIKVECCEVNALSQCNEQPTPCRALRMEQC